MKHLKYALLALLIFPLLGYSQSEVANRMKEHIVYLASDQLEGRETGSEGEKLAAAYVQAQMEGYGLKPGGDQGGWQQAFQFLNRLNPAVGSRLNIGGRDFLAGEELAIFPQSGDGIFQGNLFDLGYGIHAPQLGYDDFKTAGDIHGKVALIMRGTPDGDNPHGKFADYAPLDLKISTAVKMGAVGIVFVNPENQEMEAPIMNYGRKTSREQIPVVFLNGQKAKDLAGKVVSGKVGLVEDMRTGHNVIGNYDFGKPNTIIIGAHMDHLGYGDEGSLHRGEKAIHNGADDNASGVALILELANYIKSKPELQAFNYQFIAFSGEEKGLLGSNFYAKNPTIDFKNVNCMLNFDMVGRLDKEKNTLGINGAGTSPYWGDALAKIQIDDMKVKTSESGVGPSDHTSFYLKDLPVLHFFSGTHSDYHKPSDDENLINYEGADKIFRYVVSLLEDLNSKGEKLAFSQTKNEEEGDAPRWKVSLGVVPDYLFDGEGMRIDGVTDGKPASKAGLLAGDVVIKMGEHEVKDMMSYMRALSKFDKGDKTIVVVLRKGKAKKKKVVF